jgi:hypothetical protein
MLADYGVSDTPGWLERELGLPWTTAGRYIAASPLFQVDRVRTPTLVLRAVNDTWDNDTVGAIVGAVVGALHGRRGLPPEWIDGLLGRTGADDDGRVFELIAETRHSLGDRAGA